MATLAAGDVEAAYDAGETAAQLLELAPEFGHLTANHRAETALSHAVMWQQPAATTTKTSG